MDPHRDGTKAADIFIVDDNDALVKSLQEELERAGYSTCAVTELNEAFDAARLVRARMAVVDLNLSHAGGEEGVEVIQLLKQAHPETNVLLISSVDGDGLTELGRKAGADRVAEKPISARDLIDLAQTLDDPSSNGFGGDGR